MANAARRRARHRHVDGQTCAPGATPLTFPRASLFSRRRALSAQFAVLIQAGVILRLGRPGRAWHQRSRRCHVGHQNRCVVVVERGVDRVDLVAAAGNANAAPAPAAISSSVRPII